MATQSRKAKRGKGKRPTPRVVLSRKKKIAFAFIALVLSGALLLLVEGCLRLFRYGGDPRLFVAASVEGGRFLTCNREIGRQYFPYLVKVPKPSWDAFLKDKPSNGVRMFVLGGSTAAGFPYGNNLMFSRILNVRLQEAFPDRKIEIVNTAMSATNTYTQLDFLDEILAQKPDAILIYSGHNEYYGALGVASRESLGQSPAVARAYLKLRRLKLFVLAQDAVGLVRGMRKQGADYDPSATLMERMVGAKAIPLDSRLYRQGTKQFAENLDRIYQKARVAGVPIVVSELVSNVRDQRPFVSVATGSAPAADLVFRDAQALDREGDHEQAHRLYTKAKDLDALRFRASEEFNEILHETARRYGGAVVPMKSRFEAASPEGIIGDHLMVDHLH
ncbi:MAG TPA: SGNH/GDSL hydrolase family protein, partial [Sedimentisphaerales bacterium]|nr:SGNH/GDSL hydrolase family protein [Sedimentisphaerales bacterium]